MTSPNAKLYKGFADLARHQVRGKDYEIVSLKRPASRVAVIAPHGGAIERGTSQIARALASDDCHLYLAHVWMRSFDALIDLVFADYPALLRYRVPQMKDLDKLHS